MKKLLLSTALALVAAPAYADVVPACPIVATTGTIQWYQGCSSDNQANDGDDIKMFVDKNSGPVQTIDGSLGKNDQSFDNVRATANADFATDASGFANFKTVDHGAGSDALTIYTFVPILGQTTASGLPYLGFDGELFRGQINDLGGDSTFNGQLAATVFFVLGGSETYTFKGLASNQDFGVLGFDETLGNEKLVSRVVLSLAGTDGAWNQFKQIEFSVPGAVAAIPELPTWALGLMGFGLFGLGGIYRTRKPRYAL